MTRVYTKDPDMLLAPGEKPMYDAMLEHSKLLKAAATSGVKELLELIDWAGEQGLADKEKTERAREVYEGLHRLLAYVFTTGASFAFDQVAKAMGPQLQVARDKNPTEPRKES